MGALKFSPTTFSPSDRLTYMFSPDDTWTLELFDPTQLPWGYERLVLVTVGHAPSLVF